MNIREMKLIQKQKGPVRKVFRQVAKLAVAGLILVSPPILSGCCEKKPVVRIAGLQIPEAMKGYTGYRIVGPEKPADAGVEEEPGALYLKENPFLKKELESQPIDENPFAKTDKDSRQGMPTPVSDYNPY